MGEDGIDQALRDTIPYFLGAVASDEARKRAQLRDAKRTLSRLEAEYERSLQAAQTIDVELGSLHAEARAAGLVNDVPPSGRADLARTLQGARVARPTDVSVDGPANQDRRRELERLREEISGQLRVVMENRGLLLSERRAATDVVSALSQQESRLTALNLLPPSPVGDGHSDNNHVCPACGSFLEDPDPTSEALRHSLEELRSQIGTVTGARPSQRRALVALDAEAEALRERFRVAEGALQDLERGQGVDELTLSDSRDFTRGRIDAVLSRASLVDETAMEVLRQQLEETRSAVASLEGELDEDNRREQLTSRLVAVGRDIQRGTRCRLQPRAQHGERPPRPGAPDGGCGHRERTSTPNANWERQELGWLSPRNSSGLAPVLHSSGSASAAVPYVGRDLAHYPSETNTEAGLPEEDANRIAVRAMFELMRDVVAELSPRFQVIVCDHADLPERWFQEAVRERWRHGVKLIPADWLKNARLGDRLRNAGRHEGSAGLVSSNAKTSPEPRALHSAPEDLLAPGGPLAHRRDGVRRRGDSRIRPSYPPTRKAWAPPGPGHSGVAPFAGLPTQRRDAS